MNLDDAAKAGEAAVKLADALELEGRWTQAATVRALVGHFNDAMYEFHPGVQAAAQLEAGRVAATIPADHVGALEIIPVTAAPPAKRGRPRKGSPAPDAGGTNGEGSIQGLAPGAPGVGSVAPAGSSSTELNPGVVP